MLGHQTFLTLQLDKKKQKKNFSQTHGIGVLGFMCFGINQDRSPQYKSLVTIFCLNSRLKLDSYHITRAHFIPNHSPSLYRSLPNPIFISVSDTLRQIFVSSCLRSEVNFWESFLLIIIIKHIQHPSTRYRIVYRTLKISTRLLVLDMKLSDWVHIAEQA